AAHGVRCLVFDRRNHIGGNAHSSLDAETGIEVHNYGSHLFHCNSEEIWNYLNGFSRFTDYRHHVLTISRGRIFSMPINLDTICKFTGRSMSPAEARAWVAQQASEIDAANAKNLEDKAIGLVGRPLYEALIRGYTKKQWQTDPRELPAEIITRLP